MKMLSPLLAIALVATLVGSGQAQQARNPANPTGYAGGYSYGAVDPMFDPAWHYPDFGWGWGWPIGGTAFGDFQRGLAARIAAEGQYNLMTAEAAVSWETARGAAIENHNRWVENYWEQRDRWEARRAETRRKAITPERARHLVNLQLADLPTHDQLHPVSGRITWPTALRTPELAAWRDEVEALFMQRALGQVEDGRTIHDEVKPLIEDMRSDLSERVRHDEVTFQEFSDAKRLLEGLLREARIDPRFRDVAAR